MPPNTLPVGNLFLAWLNTSLPALLSSAGKYLNMPNGPIPFVSGVTTPVFAVINVSAFSTSSISKSNCLVIFINQIRQKIGIMFGNPETTSGGNALKFYASVRLDIRRIGAIKDKDDIIGNQTRVKVVKNKVAPPFRTVEFDIMYGEGISKNGEIVDLGVSADIIEKSGSWFSYKDQRIGQGRENVKNFLNENSEIASELEDKIKGNTVLVEEILMNPDQQIPEEEK